MKPQFLPLLWIRIFCLSLGLYSVGVFPQIAVDAPPNVKTDLETPAFDLTAMDPAVRLQDNFCQAVNGLWLKSTDIPAGLSIYGLKQELDERVQKQLREIIDAAIAEPQTVDQRKIGDLYASFMDQARRDRLRWSPLAADFARINALTSKLELPDLWAQFNRWGIKTPIALVVEPDTQAKSRYVLTLRPGGLGLTRPDQYVAGDAEKQRSLQTRYQQLIEAMLADAADAIGEGNAAESASQIVALETALAAAQRTPLSSGAPKKLSAPSKREPQPANTTALNTSALIPQANNKTKALAFSVAQPAYLKALATIVADTPLAHWKAYMRWQLINHFAPFLHTDAVNRHVAFFDAITDEPPSRDPHWKRGIDLLDRALGDALSQQYIARHFSDETRSRVEKIAAQLQSTFKQALRQSTAFDATTKNLALAKLSKMQVVLGAAANKPDYAALAITPDDLIGNLKRSAAFAAKGAFAKVGKPLDRNQRALSAYRLQAEYEARQNTLTITAAMLQPPLFNADIEEAANYGSLGSLIGHEISHVLGVFDGHGEKNTKADSSAMKKAPPSFSSRDRMLVEQYSRYSAAAGHAVDGEMTLRENIADQLGLTMAYRAYRQSLNGQPSPVIGGFNGEQRFFLGWAQRWREKVSNEETGRLMKSGNYVPANIRCMATLRNIRGFYEAFGVKAGDGMHLEPNQRMSMWPTR